MHPRLPLALAGLAVLGLGLNVVVALGIAPSATNFAAPLTQRIFYFHVPTAFASYAAFGVTLLGSVAWLRTRAPRWDRVAASAAEVGALLTTIALATGTIWSRVEFFSAETTGGEGFGFLLLRDPKFVTTMALWLVFLGYLALRRGMDPGEGRARLCSAYGVLGFLAVPMSYLSSRFSAHPGEDFLVRSVAPGMAALLWACVLIWLVVFAALFVNRLRLEDDLAAAEAGSHAPRPAAAAGDSA